MPDFIQVFNWRNYVFTAVAVISFSNFVGVLFGHTIPSIVIDFFKVAGECVILGVVFVFALTWYFKAKPNNRPKNYSIVVFDIYGKKTYISGIRTEFKNHDVAWSFMKQYKEMFPLNNFALVSDIPNSDKPTIFRYI